MPPFILEFHSMVNPKECRWATENIYSVPSPIGWLSLVSLTNTKIPWAWILRFLMRNHLFRGNQAQSGACAGTARETTHFGNPLRDKLISTLVCSSFELIIWSNHKTHFTLFAQHWLLCRIERVDMAHSPKLPVVSAVFLSLHSRWEQRES